MRANAKLRAQIHALGDPTRLAIFERLGQGPLAVVDIHKGMAVSRSAVSQHLKIMKDLGLVTDRKAGNRRLYRLDAQGTAGLKEYFQEFWTGALNSLKLAVEEMEKSK